MSEMKKREVVGHKGRQKANGDWEWEAIEEEQVATIHAFQPAPMVVRETPHGSTLTVGTCGPHGHVWSLDNKGLKEGDIFRTSEWPCDCGEIQPRKKALDR